MRASPFRTGLAAGALIVFVSACTQSLTDLPRTRTARYGGHAAIGLRIPNVTLCKYGSAATFAVAVNGGTPAVWNLNDGDCFPVYMYSGSAADVAITEEPLAGFTLDSITRDSIGFDVSLGQWTTTHLGPFTGTRTTHIAVDSIDGGAALYYNGASTGQCTIGPIGGVDLGGLTNDLFLFANGSQDANWQGATKGFVGNVLVDGIRAKERTSGGVPFAGTIFTNDATLGPWQRIVDQNPGQASASTGNAVLIASEEAALNAAFAQINALAVTPGFAGVSATSLNGLNWQNGVCETVVINVTSGFQVSSQIKITGDACDVFVLRWDADQNFGNGYQGAVKFQSGGAIVPQGSLTPGNFIHVAGDIDASGGGRNPPPPYPQGPRFNDGTGGLINGGADYNGGGFFTGYWLTTGDPVTGVTHSLSNAIFVGGWYTSSSKFSMTSGTSGTHVCPPRAAQLR